MKVSGFVFLLLFTVTTLVSAQVATRSIPEIKNEAQVAFTSGNYKESFALYRELLNRYPRDGMFSYYCGLSLFYCGENTEALQFLQEAAVRMSVPPDVYYFTGLAYMNEYRFREAHNAFLKHASNASKSELKKLQPLRKAQNASNAIALTSYYDSLILVRKNEISIHDSTALIELHCKRGSWKTFLPIRPDLGTLNYPVFVPEFSETGTELFVSASGKGRRTGADIYRIRLKEMQSYTITESPEIINTEYDEIFPWYDEENQSLYFSSSGHNSMGGLDLFVSRFDESEKSWSDPINLGFPVNSPADEFMYMPGENPGEFQLITNRFGPDSILMLCTVSNTGNRQETREMSPENLRRIGNLENSYNLTTNVISENKGFIDSIAQNIDNEVEIDNGNEFPVRLKIALQHQYVSDSLAVLARIGRMEAGKINDPSKRWAEQKKVIQWEKSAADHQVMADSLYKLIRVSEPGQKGQEKQDSPGIITRDTVIGGIKVLRYLADTNTTRTTSGTGPDTLLNRKTDADFISETSSEGPAFNILEESIYSAKNPFEPFSLPESGACYKIQLAVLSKDANWNAFGGIVPVSWEPVAGKSMKRYYAGNFTRYRDAVSALERVKREGFPQAFLVGWYEGQKLNLTKVIELERKGN